MKKALTIAMAAAALAATLSFATAQNPQRGPAPEVVGLPAHEIVAIVRAHGLAPIGVLSLRWPNYVLHAYDSRGNEARVVVDAQFGDILSVAPARPLATAYAPRYERGARIIQVPQADEHDEPAASNDNAVEEIAPPVPRRATSRPKPRSDTTSVSKRRSKALPPPPPVQRRNILSAPPLPAEDASMQRTTRFDAKIEQPERFGGPGDLVVSPSRPPPGYTPPAAVPPEP